MGWYFIGSGALNTIVWIPAVLSAAIVALRAAVRLQRRHLGMDDWLMIVAVIAELIASALSSVTETEDANTDEGSTRIYTEQAFSIMIVTVSLYCSKASVGIQLLAIIGPTSKWLRWIVITTLVVFLCLSLLGLPPQLAPDGHYGGLLFVVFLATALVDFIFSIIPIVIIRKLQIPLKKKIIISSLLSLGWIAGSFTIVRLLALQVWDTSTLAKQAHANWWAFLANSLDMSLVIICGTIASLGPLFKDWKWLSRWSLGRKKDTVTVPSEVNLSATQGGLWRLPSIADQNIELLPVASSALVLDARSTSMQPSTGGDNSLASQKSTQSMS